MGIRVKGLASAKRRLSSLADRITGVTADSVSDFADQMVDHMQSIVPVDTGTLKRSIRKQVSGTRATVGPVGVNYAGFVENGTSRTPAQPYVQPTIEWARVNGPKFIARRIKGEIN